MTPIINSSLKKYPMSWELVRRPLLHPYDSVMKAMCHHQTLDGLTKHRLKIINKAPCTIYYTETITTINKGTTVDTTNLKPGEIILMDFVFYNVTSIHGFTSMITVICAKTIILWVLTTASKISPVQIVRFILTTLNNEQHPCKHI